MFPTITIGGAPRGRGQQYGRQAAAQIAHSIASYARLFAYRRGLDWPAIQREALAYLPALEAGAPALLEEMRGIAEGAGRSLAEIVALNARTELLCGPRGAGPHAGYAEARARNRAAGTPDHGECTTVAALPGATAGAATLLAQTWDWTGDQRAACVLLRVAQPGRPDLLTLTEAGIVAKIGLNRAGLGVCLNILHSRADGQQPGMPVHVLLRLLLEAESVEAALARLAHTRAAASSCVTLADAGGQALSLEVTPGGVAALQPEDGLLAHTNHCVLASTQAGECRPLTSPSSPQRLDRARALLAAGHGRLGRDDLVAALRDHAGAPNCICRHPDPALHPCERVESVAAVLMDLTARRMELAAGVPCQVDFAPVGWG